MKCQIIVSQPVTFRKHLDYEFTSTAAADMISSRALRQDYNIKRDEFRRRQESLNSQIKLIDGSKMDLSDSKPHKLRSQPKQDAKIESQIAIKQQRTQEKIFSEIVRILMSGILSVELFKKPVWRLTRMVPNSDMRGYSIFWIIDNENDITAYKEKLTRKFEEMQGLVRYHLGQSLEAKFSPKLTFKYEHYESPRENIQ